MPSARLVVIIGACLLLAWHLHIAAQTEDTDTTASDTAADDDIAIDADAAPLVPVPERELRLVPHPVYPSRQAESVFSPLADYLSEITPFEVRLAPVRDFHRYWLNIRRGDMPELVIEEAHLAAWRIANQDYVPLVRADTPQTFHLLVADGLADAELTDFVGRRISTMPSPSLGYIVLADWFRDPLRRPRIISEASSWEEGVDIIFAAEADAIVMPGYLADQYPNLHSIQESEPLPGLTISVSPAVDPQIHETLRAALIVLHDQPHYFSALNELHIERFVPAEADEYDGLEQMLERIFSL